MITPSNTDRMTPEDIAELRRLLAKVPGGPWWYQEESDAYTHIVRRGEHEYLFSMSQDTSGKSEAMARLYALLRNHAATLLTAAESGEAAIAKARAEAFEEAAQIADEWGSGEWVVKEDTRQRFSIRDLQVRVNTTGRAIAEDIRALKLASPGKETTT